ncbi:MAG: Mif2/CENP-C like-domain-containing protein [Benniella sp.]|nr:MAG: Mif2/CENP-C like-domain-containing protein [Benniella sp.]
MSSHFGEAAQQHSHKAHHDLRALVREPSTTINQKVAKDTDGFDNIEDFWNKHRGSLEYTYRPNLGQDDGMHSGPDDIVIRPLDATVRGQKHRYQTKTTRLLSGPPTPGNSQDCPAPNDSLSTGDFDVLYNPQPEDLIDGGVSSGSQADESNNDDGSSASDSPFDSSPLWMKSTVKNHPFTNGRTLRRRFRSSLNRTLSSRSIPDRNMNNSEKSLCNVKEPSSESSRRVTTDLSEDPRQPQIPPLGRPSKHTRETSKVDNARHGHQRAQKEQEGHSGSSTKPQLSDMTKEDLADEAPNPHEDPPVNHCRTKDSVLQRGVRDASEARKEPLLAAQQPTTSRPRLYQTRSVTENAQTIEAATAHQEAHQESSPPASSSVIEGRVPLGELPIHLFTNTPTPIPPDGKGKGKRNRDDLDDDLLEEKRRRNSDDLYTRLDETDSVEDERTDVHEHNDDEPGRSRYTRSSQQQYEIATGLSKTTAATTCIAEFQDQVQFQDVAEGQYQLHRGLEDNSISSGIIKIPRSGQKPNVNAFKSTVIFHVLKGRVKATIHKYTFTVGPGGSFMVPRGNQYMIENLSQGECTLFFAQSKDAVQEGTKADDFETYAEAISSFSRSVI